MAERVKLSKTRSESSSTERPVLGSEISSIGVRAARTSAALKGGGREGGRAGQRMERSEKWRGERQRFRETERHLGERRREGDG